MLASVLQSSHEDNNSSGSAGQDEILRSARANVGLIADGIWAPSGQDETYRKLNRALWIRSSQIAARYAELDSHQQQQQQQRHETRSRVRDVIPDSRLAIYGDFEYENEPSQEDFEEEKRRKDESPEITNGESKGKDKESWLLDEVEEFVAWAEEACKRSRRRCRSLSKSNGPLKSSRKTDNRAAQEKSTTGETPSYSEESTAPRFSVTNVSEAQLEGRIFNEAVRSLWRTNSTASNSSQSTRTLRQCQRELGMLRPQTTTTTTTTARRVSDVQLTHSSFQNERLRLPSSRCQYSYMHQTLNIVQQRVNSPVTAPLPPLCVDVPEFFPKGPNTWPCLEDHQQQQQPAKPTQFYAVPTMASESSPYQDEMFPYKGHVAGRKPVAVYQNPVVPMVPTPLVSAVIWPPNWAQQRLLPPRPIHIHQLPAAPPLPPNCSMMPPSPVPQAQPTAAPVMCPTVVHRPIKIHESTISKPSPIPVYQRPQQQQSGKSSQEYSQRKKSQGVDFSNLILLTKSAMKVRRNQSKAAKKAFNETGKGQSSAKAEGYSARWLDKGCQPKREREFVTVSTIPRLPITRSEDLACSTNSGSGSRRTSQSADDELTEASRKRLYRDVLESSSVTPFSQEDDEDELRFEKRYDELERQAMEQYRTSEECLALRYQELEQQALEQYRNAGSSDSISLEQESLLHIRTTNNSNDDDSNVVAVENDADETRDYTSSSGFGKYSRSSKKTVVAADVDVDDDSEKGNKQLQQRIKILRAEKDGASSPAKVVHRAASEGSLRPIVVAKRLSAISTSNSAGYGRESKNTIRGASGDKIAKPSSISTLKRRLIPMSPSDRKKSGTDLMKNASLDPMKAVQTLDKHVAAYYRNTKVIPTGSGDDKINNTGVWRMDNIVRNQIKQGIHGYKF